jgi:hypothetical protein
VAGCCEHGNETLSSVKASDLVNERLLSSQDGFYCVELVNNRQPFRVCLLHVCVRKLRSRLWYSSL